MYLSSTFVTIAKLDFQLEQKAGSAFGSRNCVAMPISDLHTSRCCYSALVPIVQSVEWLRTLLGQISLSTQFSYQPSIVDVSLWALICNTKVITLPDPPVGPHDGVSDSKPLIIHSFRPRTKYPNHFPLQKSPRVFLS